LILISWGTCFANLRDRRPFGLREDRSFNDLLLDLLQSVIGGDSQCPAQQGDSRVDAAAVVDPCPYHVAFADGFADDLLEGLVGGDRKGGCERSAERGVRGQAGIEQHAKAGLAQKLGFRRLVEHVEARSNLGLEWKLMQKPCAKCVDGLDLETTRRLQRQREESPCSRPPRRIGIEIGHPSDRRIEVLIVERGPAPQLVEHAVRHIGGGGLGERDAEDLSGLDAVEQEAGHALRQNMGLARSGIGGDPGRYLGVRRRDLPPQHFVRDDARRVHSVTPMPSSSSVPPTDHSLTRERWS